MFSSEICIWAVFFYIDINNKTFNLRWWLVARRAILRLSASVRIQARHFAAARDDELDFHTPCNKSAWEMRALAQYKSTLFVPIHLPEFAMAGRGRRRCRALCQPQWKPLLLFLGVGGGESRLLWKSERCNANPSKSLSKHSSTASRSDATQISRPQVVSRILLSPKCSGDSVLLCENKIAPAPPPTSRFAGCLYARWCDAGESLSFGK